MHDRDALLAGVDLRALADDLLGPGTQGRTPMWRCPSDQHAQTGRTPPVSVFDSRRGEQRWRCHGCGEGGTAIDLVLACRGGTTRDAMTYLAERAGQREQADDRRAATRPDPARAMPLHGCADPVGLDRYVNECAARLWTPAGGPMRHWLTVERGLSEDVLRRNSVGADLGPGRQTRPNGVPRSRGIVLPTMVEGQAVYAQLRLPRPWRDGLRYLNPTSELATNPRLCRIRPAETHHPQVVVTEGAIDALSAAAAGYRSIAVLAATYGDEAVAAALAKLPHPLVLAFDADDAGRAGAQRLAALLDARQRPPVVVDLGSGDLNDALCRSTDWPRQLDAMVAQATASPAVGVGLSR